MRIKNNSDKIKNFKLKNKSWVVVNPQDSADLPGSVLTNEKDVEQLVDEKEVPEPVVEPEQPSKAPSDEDKPEKLPKQSKSALKKLDKEEQIELLKKYGVDEETLQFLSTEPKRVKHLLKLQEENDKE